jgi:hypothetical protein
MVHRVRIDVSELDILCFKEVEFFGFMLKFSYRVIWLYFVIFLTNHDEGIGIVATLIFPRWLEATIQHGLD